MKVFVAGATGAIGKRAVRRLLEAGHEVTAVARTAAKATELRRMGAFPVTVDLFDPAAVAAAVAGHDAVVNLATKIPSPARAALPGSWNENDRIRREASRNLVDAALSAGATRYIQESISFGYPDRGSEWIDETVPPDIPAYAASVLDAEAQATRFAESGGTAVVLRFGMFYGAGSAHTEFFVSTAQAGLSPFVGRTDASMSFIHLDDAAEAVVAALDAEGGIYNVVDDEPLTRGEHARVLARALGRRRLLAGPTAATRIGGAKVEMLTRSQRVSNGRFREATGWSPHFRSTREGLPAVVAEMGLVPAHHDGLRRGILAILTLTALQLGVWAAFAPRSFYDDFPGGGRAWVAADGPYNEHLVRDFGSLNLALLVITAVALWKLTPLLVRTAAAAWLVYSVPHFVYHLRHLEPYDTFDAVANVITLGLTVALPIVLLALRSAPADAAGSDAADGRSEPADEAVAAVHGS